MNIMNDNRIYIDSVAYQSNVEYTDRIEIIASGKERGKVFISETYLNDKANLKSTVSVNYEAEIERLHKEYARKLADQRSEMQSLLDDLSEDYNKLKHDKEIIEAKLDMVYFLCGNK